MVSRTVEKLIYEKYNHHCAFCNRETGFDEGEIDHIKPQSKGGSDSPRNLQWLCPRCNNLKNDRLTNGEVRESLGLKQFPKTRGEKTGQSYKCKLIVKRRVKFNCPLSKKRADKLCLNVPIGLFGDIRGTCRNLLISRK